MPASTHARCPALLPEIPTMNEARVPPSASCAHALDLQPGERAQWLDVVAMVIPNARTRRRIVRHALTSRTNRTLRKTIVPDIDDAETCGSRLGPFRFIERTGAAAWAWSIAGTRRRRHACRPWPSN